jgi:rsbT co-antagonist protein RsbR
MSNASRRLAEVLKSSENDILASWVQQQLPSHRRDLMGESELRDQSRGFLRALAAAMEADPDGDPQRSTEWTDVRSHLAETSRIRARQGFTPSETASFVFSLKQPVFERLRNLPGLGPAELGELTWATSQLLDRLGLSTVEEYQRGREEVVARQQQEMLELSTPVVRLWDNVLALPLIGTLDSARTQVVMETLLQEIVKTSSTIAIIDITGVPTVDTLVAQHLLKTVAAARLMGAECIISGIRPQIAQTIVHLGVELGDVTTKATLADAFAVALRRNGMTVAKVTG